LSIADIDLWRIDICVILAQILAITITLSLLKAPMTLSRRKIQLIFTAAFLKLFITDEKCNLTLSY
jgi:hypothetical protein